MNAPPLLARLDARDRALFVRLALDGSATRFTRAVWCLLTALGGSRGSVIAAIVLAMLPRGSVSIAWHALLVLGLSHAVVQLIKRHAVRERPTTRLSIEALIAVPDRFSFPSGHSCAAMAVALCYASLFPGIATGLMMLAILVGASRVMLGVHYPGDVVAGQGIALLTFVLMRSYPG